MSKLRLQFPLKLVQGGNLNFVVRYVMYYVIDLGELRLSISINKPLNKLIYFGLEQILLLIHITWNKIKMQFIMTFMEMINWMLIMQYKYV